MSKPLDQRAETPTAPLVSIITPTFNHRQYIGQCLESAIQQTEPRWEQIVIDDGSTDGTGEVVSGYTDPRIRYVRLEHRGIEHLGDSYNRALGMARGELVAVLEGDDFWPADKLERQIPAFEDPGVVLSWGIVGATNASGDVVQTIPTARFVAGMQDRTPGETVRSLLRRNHIPAGTVMCRRQALLAVGGFRQPVGIPTTDYPTWLELCRTGSFAPVSHVLGFHRRHDAQITALLGRELDRAVLWGPHFVYELTPGERQALGLSIESVRRIARLVRADLDYSAGREALRGSRNAVAKAFFRRAIRMGSGPTRVKGLVGLACSHLGFDIDAFADALNRFRRDRSNPA